MLTISFWHEAVSQMNSSNRQLWQMTRCQWLTGKICTAAYDNIRPDDTCYFEKPPE
jgi:hypothetical protein